MNPGSQKAHAFVFVVLLSASLFTTFRASLSELISFDMLLSDLPQSYEGSLSSKENATNENLALARTSQKLLFTKNASNFVDVFADCIFDQNCHVLYHHVKKTGGTFIASTLYPILNQQNYRTIEWCCYDLMMKRFRRYTRHYCDKRLGVYEVMGSQFQEVVETCHGYYSSQTEKHRAIALVTVREPVQRLVSGIHQICNKKLDELPPKWQATCRQCSYHNASDDWDEMVKENNQIYEELNYDLPIELLVLDSLMIDRFLQLLEKRLPESIPKGEPNEEKKDVCDFHLPSELFRKLIPAQLAYRKTLVDDPDDMGWPEVNHGS